MVALGPFTVRQGQSDEHNHIYVVRVHVRAQARAQARAPLRGTHIYSMCSVRARYPQYGARHRAARMRRASARTQMRAERAVSQRGALLYSAQHIYVLCVNMYAVLVGGMAQGPMSAALLMMMMHADYSKSSWTISLVY